jgi:hypothetical protein
MKIDKEELHYLYMEWVERVSEDLDYKFKFTTEEIVNAIANILENNPQLIKENNGN